ncbi:TadE/TadG family type IV pilus assembly protein [Maritimibacter fusiformis]|uniref:Pilus assembly protein n=1 Tax=Maritimibacter fusiformis TaxID=2603819 RepID=A0A5D0RMS6_9RHOB|nr:TadE/TadG family type IV pilus assembly protein [Maritimibacter fusiformis]TYB82940.1 pilus assembly protein [Maritimibacter fusiformis]
MFALARRVLGGLVRGFRREDGTATIEFVILFPAFMMLFLSSFEMSLFLARNTLLERAVDLNVRALRLGSLEPATSDELKRRICNDAMILPQCEDNIMVELTNVSPNAWNLPSAGITCTDRDAEIQPALDFEFGRLNDLMMVRVCVVVDPFFGTTPYVMNLPKDDSGGFTLTASSTFVNEP